MSAGQELEPEFAKQLSRLLQYLENSLRKGHGFYDHGARACVSQASKLRERILEALAGP